MFPQKSFLANGKQEEKYFLFRKTDSSKYLRIYSMVYLVFYVVEKQIKIFRDQDGKK